MILNLIFTYTILILFNGLIIFSPAETDSLETRIQNTSGIEKLYLLEKAAEELMHVSPNKSLIYAKEGLSLAEYYNISDKKIKFLSVIGLGYRLKGDYNQSLEYYLKTLPLVEEQNNPLEIANIKNEIGNVYNYIGILDKALEYYKESMLIRENEKDTLYIAKSLNNIGNIYKNKGELQLALNTLFKSLSLKIKMGDKNGVVTTQKNIGSVYTKLGEIDSALIYFEKALDAESTIGDSLGVINSLILMGTAYYENNEFEKAEAIALKALGMAKISETNYFIFNCNYLLYQIYEKKGNFGKALSFLKDYLKIRNEMFNEERHKASLEVEAAYQLREKEKQVHELELNKKDLQSNILIIISIVAVGSVIIFIFIYKDKIKNSSVIRGKNEELQKAIQHSERANQMKSDFLAQMSHEIRTPINTILNYTSLLKMEFENDLPEDLEGSFNSIQNAATRLLRTIDLVLNMSDIESGTYEIIPQKMNILNDIVEPIYLEFYNSVKAKGLEFKIIKEINPDTEVEIDAYTILQVMANLVDNSIKYTASGRIEIRSYLINNKPAIDITDTGIGISEKYIPQLFTKFSQEDQGYTRKFEDTGLGLSLVKKYCEINNCDISVKSRKGEGTTFTLIFNNFV